MMTPARIVRFIGIMGLLVWLGMVGWVAKTSQAQNSGAPPTQLGPALTSAPKQETAGKEAGPPPPIAPAAISVKENSAALSLPKDQGAPPINPIPLAREKAPTAPEPVGMATLPAAPDVSPLGGDDPEKSAQSFMERSQKEAQRHLKALTAEAEQLRTRLTKLDSGIKKWQDLLNALSTAQHGQPLSTATGPTVDQPSNLEPIAPGSNPGRHADKRVKWASASAGAAGSEPQPAKSSEPVAPVAPAAQPAAPPAQIAAPTAVPR
jgi:hypothetical protein